MFRIRYYFATKTLIAILCMAVFLPGYTSNSLASDGELRDLLLSCSNFENDTKRLECVDKIIRSITSQTVVESIQPQSHQEPLIENLSIEDSSGNELAQSNLQEPQEVTTQTSLGYELTAVFKDSKNRWNFEFENGEVWQQIEPGYLPKPKNLPVRVDISDGVFGSHDLRAENFGKPVKVKRIK